MSADHWSTIEAIFHSALALPDGERAAFIRERAGGDEAVAREVESLLDAHAQSTGIKATEDRTDWIGKRVGDYRVTREIGRGGMGAIYLAVRDDDAFRKEVAVKVIKRGMDTDAIVRRFRNERQILADLDHPNIARLLDGGTTEDGLPFFVMEYIDGQPLDDYCRTLSIDDRLRLFGKVCEAVGYAHQRGVVHRDLKPSNILIAKSGEPKLLDFGIAKVLDTESIDITGTLTAAGHHVLTPAYASPEQIRGEQVTPASDVYSIGVMLYEVLTGRRPYPVRGGSLDQMASAIATSEITRPSVITSARQLRGDIDNIVMMALAVDPARRYATAGDLARDVARHLAGQRVLARRKIAWRRRAAPAAGLALVLAGVVGSLYWPRKQATPDAPSPPARITSLAVLPFQAADGQQATKLLGDSAAASVVAKLDGPRLIARALNPAKYADIERDPIAIGREQGVDVIADGTLERRIDRVHVNAQLFNVTDRRLLWSGSFDAGLFSIEDQLAQRMGTAILGKLTPREAANAAAHDTNNLEARLIYDTARRAPLAQNAQASIETIKRFQRAIELDPKYAAAYRGLAAAYANAAFYGFMDIPVAREGAITASKRALELEPNSFEALTQRAKVLDIEWKWEETEAMYLRSLELNPNQRRARHGYANLLTYLKRFDEALAQIHEAAAANPLSPETRTAEVVMLNAKRDFQNAIRVGEASLVQSPNFYTAFVALAHSHAGLKNYERAISIYTRVLSLLPGEHFARAGLIGAYGITGRKTEAYAIAKDAERDYAQHLFQPTLIAMGYAEMGDRPRALEWLERAYRDRDPMLSLVVSTHFSFDSIRGDPRYHAVLDGMKLPR